MPELTYTDVRNILAILESSNVDELSVEFGDFKLDVRRGGALLAPAIVAPPRPMPAAPPAASSHVAVPAPMLGTFSRSSAPDAPPLVEVGSPVAAGDPICVITVLDSANTVVAPNAGRVAAILIEDAALVEFGQTLMLLDPP